MQQPEKQKLILASKSPRRKQLLQQAGLTFTVIPSDFDEEKVPLTKPEAYVQTLALEKARQVSKQHPNSWIIGADTIVIIAGTVLGKPDSHKDAHRMLTLLSGRTHQVVTGYALMCHTRQKHVSDAVKTDVHFKHLTDDEIQWYVSSREPFDKAGSYAIQGLGTFMVKDINGSYTNVVGLPVCEVMAQLKTFGVIQYSKKKAI